MHQGIFSYNEVMNRIPWCVLLMMVSDQGRMGEKQEEPEVIGSEREELEFFGLI